MLFLSANKLLLPHYLPISASRDATQVDTFLVPESSHRSYELYHGPIYGYIAICLLMSHAESSKHREIRNGSCLCHAQHQAGSQAGWLGEYD